MTINQVDFRNLKQLLVNKTFIIPDYQRQYRWDCTHWSELLSDLFYTYHHLDYTHFLGQLVVYKEDHRYYLIDGQQRVTTSFLLLKAFYALFKEYDEAYDTSFSDMIYSDYFDDFGFTVSKEKRLHFEQADYLDREAFLFTDDIYSERLSSHDLFYKAYTYFKTELTSFIVNFDHPYDTLKDLFLTFTHRFLFLYAETDELSDSFIIFETVNARGVSLKEHELVKNRMVYLLDLEENDTSFLTFWQDLNNDLGDTLFDQLIRDTLYVRGAFSSQKNVYQTFKTYILTQDDAKHFLNDLKRLSPFYLLYAAPLKEDTLYRNHKLFIPIHLLSHFKLKEPLRLILYLFYHDYSLNDIYHLLMIFLLFYIHQSVFGQKSTAFARDEVTKIIKYINEKNSTFSELYYWYLSYMSHFLLTKEDLYMHITSIPIKKHANLKAILFFVNYLIDDTLCQYVLIDMLKLEEFDTQTHMLNHYYLTSDEYLLPLTEQLYNLPLDEQIPYNTDQLLTYLSYHSNYYILD